MRQQRAACSASARPAGPAPTTAICGCRFIHLHVGCWPWKSPRIIRRTPVVGQLEGQVMALMDFIKKQFIDILEWTEDGDGTLAWRYPMAGNEIQYGASLTVRESQVASSSTKARWPTSSAPACTS
jgi:hypothetical protein